MYVVALKSKSGANKLIQQKVRTVNALGSEGHAVSVTTTQHGHCSLESSPKWYRNKRMSSVLGCSPQLDDPGIRESGSNTGTDL